ncbi:LysM peptidoglycan-binding domain-containing protein [Oceanisphaera arctica]|uniref:LysM peptidoglycan-binding domain-containing protein n=1 Tax=Oceanisphaera arctica TaxID=641510 RepID=UPI000CEBC527|nr:LysM peptidoglycan-binding domain-containing protein [Oceanisphaera arctica]
MKQRCRFLLGLLAGCCFGLQANTLESNTSRLELNESYPERYTVRKGDTLWDISAHFLKSPWLWPKLWQANQQIANPHLIYPGDVLRLIWVDGQPRLVKDDGTNVATVRLSPRVRTEAAVATIPLSSMLNFVDSHRVMSPAVFGQASYILGDQQGREAMVKGSSVYVRGQLTSGTIYGVYRPQEILTDRFTHAELGQKAALVGTVLAQEQRGYQMTEVQVSSMKQEMRQGDKVLPLTMDGGIAAFYYPRPGPALDQAYILAMGTEGSVTGRHGVVFINKGNADGVRSGDLYAVMKPGPGVYDVNPGSSGRLSYADSAGAYLRTSSRPEQLPAEAVARIMVFKVDEQTSAALVLDSKGLVQTNYSLSNVSDAGFGS